MFTSLVEALSLVEEHVLTKEKNNIEPVINFICKHQIRHGRDAGVFVESRDVSTPFSQLYTGERLQTHLAAKNVLTIDAARAIIISGVSSSTASETLALANNWLTNQCFANFCISGECKISSIAFLRYLSLQGASEQVKYMLLELSKYRDGKGGWSGFPFFYTLSVLTEITHLDVIEELRYAFPYIETKLNHSKTSEPFESRRRAIFHRICSRLL